MENRAARPQGEKTEEQTSLSDSRQEKARTGIEGLLSRWRDVLQSDKEDDEKEETGDEDSTETTPSKSRDGKLSSFLKSFLPKPEQIRDDASEAPAPPITTGDNAGVEAGFDPYTLLRPAPEAGDRPTEEPEPGMNLPAPEASVDFEPEVNETEEPVHDVPDVSAGEGGGTIPPIETSEPPEPPDRGRTPIAVIPPVPTERVNGPPVPDVLPQPVSQQTRLERGAVAGLLTVDLLNYAAAKRRDTKIEAAAEKRAKGIDKKIEQEQRNREALERRLADREAQTVFERGRQANKQAEYQEVALRPDTKRAPEQVSPVSGPERVERIMSRSLGRPEVKEVQARAQAERVLHKVEQAAEKNIPIEQTYEMRHEAKGADANLGWSGSGTTTTVQSSSGSAPQQQPSILPLPTSTERPAKTQSQRGPSPEMIEYYKNAAKTGAAIALVLLLVFMVAFTLARN